MIYTAPGFWDGSVAADDSTEPLWVANWEVTCPNLPTGWTSWKFWQSADNGTVPGISGAVDLDEFNGTLSKFQAFAGGPAWGAKYVAQSFPLATSALVMTAGETLPAFIELTNIGTGTWTSSTRLGTTEPRDRSSVFTSPDWIASDRPSAVAIGRSVAPGQSYKFLFDLTAPSEPGTYYEYFGVVEEGVAWFGDPGQGGPPDNQLEVQIRVVRATDAGGDASADAGEDVGDAAAEDAALGTEGGIGAQGGAGGSGGSTSAYGGSAGDTKGGGWRGLGGSGTGGSIWAALGGGGAMGATGASAASGRHGDGCACWVGGRRDGGGGRRGISTWMLLLAVGAIARRRHPCAKRVTTSAGTLR